MKSLKVFLSTSALALSSLASAVAAPVFSADDFKIITIDTKYNNIGFEFIANKNMTATALGSFSMGVDVDPVSVGLWDSHQNLLASAFITKSSITDGFFKYTEISSVNLLAGENYYVASAGYTYFAFGPINPVIVDGISFVGDAYADDGGLSLEFPADSDHLALDSAGFFGANLQVTSAQAVPEPETYVMVLAGLGALGLATRRRKPR